MPRKTQQISVTVDTQVLADVRRLSEYVSNALAEEVRRHHLARALNAFEREHGAVTSTQIADARAKLRRPARRRAA